MEQLEVNSDKDAKGKSNKKKSPKNKSMGKLLCGNYRYSTEALYAQDNSPGNRDSQQYDEDFHTNPHQKLNVTLKIKHA